MKGKPTVVLSQELWSKISRLHTYAGGTEWSGPIYYDITGDLKQPDDMVMEVEHLILKNVGSGAYTEYEFGPEMIDLYDDRPKLMTMPMGHMH